MTRLAMPPRADRSSGSRSEPASGRALYFVAAALGVAVLVSLVSVIFGLNDRIEHWGKLVHAVDAASVTFVVGVLLLGWRERTRVDLSDELSTLLTIFVGILFGVGWEVAEFMIDWVLSSDLQKSNADTMTDLLCTIVAAILAGLAATRVYCHATSTAERDRLGGVAEWLVDGPSRLLDRHGLALMMIVACVIAAMIAALWFAGRPAPGVPLPPF